MSTSVRVLKGLTSPIRLAPLAMAGLLLLLGVAESRAQPPGAGDSSTVRRPASTITARPYGCSTSVKGKTHA
jgi:hypothetical protein